MAHRILAKADIDLLRSLWKDGWSDPKIAKEMRVSDGTVWMYRKRLGLAANNPKSVKGAVGKWLNHDQVVQYYHEGLCSREIGYLIGKSAKVVQDYAAKHNIPRPKHGGPCGIWNGQYKRGRTVDKSGYILVRVHGHPFAHYSPKKSKDGVSMSKPEWAYIREHRLVMERVLGRYLLPREVVHHKDGNKRNN